MDLDHASDHGLPCLLKYVHEMVDDPSTDSIVSWSSTEKGFIVWDEYRFCRDVLPRFLPFRAMAPFVREIEKLGFKKIESEQLEFASDYFVRGHPEIVPPPGTRVLKRLSASERVIAFERVKKMGLVMKERVAKFKAEREAQIKEVA